MVLAADTGIDAGARVLRTLLAELLCALVPPSERNAVTAWVYRRASVYRPRGAVFDQGLFDWELEALRHPSFPSQGRILVGAAGGGREMLGLAQLGYQVVGFEPSSLAEDARQAVAHLPGSELVQASYDDVVAVAQGRPGPLTEVFNRPFDGVILGWASLSHLVTADERLALLRALRVLAPAAPVLCSFLPAGSRRPFAILRRRLRRPGDEGLSFWPRLGFVERFGREQIEALASDAGYEPAFRSDQHAAMILVPAPL